MDLLYKTIDKFQNKKQLINTKKPNSLSSLV